jgi:hypothetical protein
MSAMIGEYDPNKHSSIWIHRKYSIDVRRLDYDEDIAVFWYYTGRIRALKAHLRNSDRSFAGLDSDGIVRKALLEQMKISDEVRRRIDDFKSSAGWPEKVIGLHNSLHRYEDQSGSLRRVNQLYVMKGCLK